MCCIKIEMKILCFFLYILYPVNTRPGRNHKWGVLMPFTQSITPPPPSHPVTYQVAIDLRSVIRVEERRGFGCAAPGLVFRTCCETKQAFCWSYDQQKTCLVSQPGRNSTWYISRSGRLMPALLTLELIYLNFQPLEVVSRYRDPQLQVAENYPYLFNNFEHKCFQILMLRHTFHSQKQWFGRLIKQIENVNSGDQQDKG